jgi:Na+-transporting methylmalonyl-CoA/oxaloacetate decarboxylase gamma subunit
MTPSLTEEFNGVKSTGVEMKLAARLTVAGLALVFAFTSLYVAAFHAP